VMRITIVMIDKDYGSDNDAAAVNGKEKVT
jgi:hypothetical protein